MAQGRYAEAARRCEAGSDSRRLGAYARFNLGVALVRSGDAAQGQRWLEAVGTHAGGHRRAALAARPRQPRARLSRCCSSSEAEPAVAALTPRAAGRPVHQPCAARARLGRVGRQAPRPRAGAVARTSQQRRLLDAAVQESLPRRAVRLRAARVERAGGAAVPVRGRGLRAAKRGASTSRSPRSARAASSIRSWRRRPTSDASAGSGSCRSCRTRRRRATCITCWRRTSSRKA